MYMPADTKPNVATAVGAPARGQAVLRIGAERSVYFEGDVARRVYLLRAGVLRLSRMSADGRRQVIGFAYPGDVVGFPHGGRRSTDCDALVASEAVSIPLGVLTDPCSDHPLRDRVVAAALTELRTMQDHFMALALKSAPERFAGFLEVLAGRLGRRTEDGMAVEMPMSRADIADYLGMTVETVSRRMTALRRAGIVALEGTRRLIVRDPAGLAAAAGAA